MPDNQTATDVSLDALETMVEEVTTEGIPVYQKIYAKWRRTKRGTQAYEDLLQELCVAAHTLKIKAEAAMELIDEYTDTLPD